MSQQVKKKLIISGRVQGVGYRFWLKSICDEEHIFGSVKNRKDGNVEAKIFCDELKFKKLINLCYKGPISSSVENIVEEDIFENLEYKKFIIEKTI